MSFYIQSIDQRDLQEMDGFQIDIYDIKKYLCDIGNTYLLIAYRVYEMSLNERYKARYKTLVEACQAELGWKKSTVYNMLNIVKRFGQVENGRISYYSLMSNVNQFSYSQLCEMLSLSDKQIEKITPDTTVKEIRQMKKVQTSGKNVATAVVDVEPSFIIAENGIEEVTDRSDPAVAPGPEEVSEVQTVEKGMFELTLGSSSMLLLNKLLNLSEIYYSFEAGVIRTKMIKSGYKWDYDCDLEGFEMKM